MAYIGDGTINNPYLIDNITDFGIVLAITGFGGNYNTRYIKLIADLEFNTMGLIDDYIFSVAGLENNTVNIDGNGHWIRNHTRFYNNVLYGNYSSTIIFNNIKMSIYDLSTSTLPFIQRSYTAQQIHFNRCVLYIYSTNPNGSQFFITHVPTEWLNYKHTIFGEIVSAEDQKVVNAIAQGDVMNEVVIEGDVDAFLVEVKEAVDQFNSALDKE
jgi:hypothetical protein